RPLKPLGLFVHTITGLAIALNVHGLVRLELMVVLVVLTGLAIALNVHGLVRLELMVVLVVLTGLAIALNVHGLVRLELMVVLVVLNRWTTLNPFAGLDRLGACAGLDTARVSRAYIAELLLQIRVLEWHVGAMRWIELPALRLHG